MSLLISLINTDSEFCPNKNIRNSIIPVEGVYDYAVLSNNGVGDTLDNLTNSNIKTSNSFIVHDVVKNKTIPKLNSGSLIFVESTINGEKRVVDHFRDIGPIDSIYLTRGTHNIVLASDKGSLDKITDELSKNNNIITFFTLSTDKPIKIDSFDLNQDLGGRNYYNELKEYELHEKDVIEYALACKDMARSLKEFNPTLVYAPIRGSKPMTDMALESLRPLDPEKKLNVFYPVTSSFVNGRKINKFELNRLKEKNPGLLSRIAYIDELNSGGMIRGHSKEMFSILEDEIEQGKTKVLILGLANKYGEKINRHLIKRFRKLYLENKMEFFPINSLLTMDRRQILGHHFLDHSLGPNSVPFLNKDLTYHPDHEYVYNVFADVISNNNGKYKPIEKNYLNKKENFMRKIQNPN